MQELTIRTRQHTEFIKLDAEIQRAVQDSGAREGICVVFVPHTTAGVTINENADPDVMADMHAALEKIAPWHGSYAHAEGNTAAHVKASLMGFCQTLIIHDGRLVLGTWQSIYFCEFDGPRTRRLHVQVIPSTQAPA